MAERPRRRAERFGRRGEYLAALWLIATLHRIRAIRAKTPVGEIDLIASRGRQLIFIEVKSRASTAQRDLAFGAVSQRRIAAAARYWLAAHPRLAGHDLRFDVIGLAPFSRPVHLKGAFEAGSGEWR